MAAPLLARSFDVTSEGRTLTGIAYYFDQPSKVRDPGGPAYLEEFARSSADKTIAEHPVVPLLRNHDLTRDPVGVATFRPSAEGLIFEAPLSRTRDADETLELVNDGAMRSVSVRFAAYKNRTRPSADGMVTTRVEIGLKELSVCPTGFGQHQGAGVLAVRSLDDIDDDEAGTPRLDVVRQRLVLMAPLIVP